MNKVTIFAGPQMSGKTTKAGELSKEKKSEWLFRNYYEGYHIKDIDENTEIVILDEVGKSDIRHIKEFVEKEFLTFRPPYAKEKITIKRPETIICTNLDATEILKEIDKKVKVEVVNFPERK